jgi:predicted Zn-dependent protease
MASSRIDIFKQILEGDPTNSAVLFGLAKEYEKAEATTEMIETLNRYLAAADDQGNAYGMLARAYEKAGQREQARAAYARGIAAANSHGHPGMAEEYRTVLSSDYEG